MKNDLSIHKLAKAPFLAELLAILGGFWGTLQLWRFAHLQESVLDEGAYVYKGFLFATGQYQPYQPYGPWTNHMPLAFLIPGQIQAWFGPGIYTARFFAIFLAVLMMAGLWILSRRLGNRWWAAAAIWIMALNPAILKAYSTAVSQGLVACMLVWTLVLVLGERRPLWQIVLGSILAGLVVMTRENMLPVLPLVVLYVLWENGWKAGLASGLAGGLSMLLWYALYWPDIMQVWIRLPRWASPFLDVWRLPRRYDGSWDPQVTNAGRILSASHAIRFQFTAIIGVLGSILFWPKKWKNRADFRSAVFLLALFFTHLAIHMWSALGKEYCVFCFAGYLAFFAFLGWLLLIATYQNWRQQLPTWLQIVVAGCILLICAGLGFGSFEELGYPIYDISVPQWLLGSDTPGNAALGAILVNKFGLSPQDLRRILPTAFGIGAGILVLLFAWLCQAILKRALVAKDPSPEPKRPPSFGYLALVIFLVLGTLFSPTIVLGGGHTGYDCSGDVLASYDAAGRHLAETVPPGSLVYWKGPLSALPLLYLPDARIFPPQINDGYSYIEVGEDSDLIYRSGRWNDALAQQWIDEADFVLIEARYFKGWLRDTIKNGKYEQLPPTPPVVYCRENAQILIFRRLP